MFSNPPAKGEIRIVKLNCVNCGFGLDISEQMERLACGYCGTQQIVERSGGAVHLRGVTEAIARVQTGTDKTAAELALARLSKELEAVRQQRAEKEYYWQFALANCRNKLQNVTIIAVILGTVPSVFVAAMFAAFAGAIGGDIGRMSGGLIGFLAPLSAIAILTRTQLVKHDSYNSDKVIERCNHDLMQVDKHIANLQMKMRQNYQIANA
ncbi:MAG TPA: hypothetical protein VF648_03170 [Pyrinomonadaceae bacterium]|jgi:ribosomal protein S27AE